MSIHIQGWLPGIHHCPSPNCNERPKNTNIDLLVIHNISLPPGQFGGSWIKEFFLNKLDSDKHPYFKEIFHLQVSAHFLIERNGEITQFVPTHKRAWHAGESSFQGRHHCNDFSIGIELEGTDSISYTTAQYHELAQLSTHLMQNYPGITKERITGHEHIAPGRKTDPGKSFDWTYYFSLLDK
jgi:AmpD protein